jgi:hypothetical protein
LAEQFENLTPYQYASNSPVGNIDLDGLEAVSACGVPGVPLTPGQGLIMAKSRNGNLKGSDYALAEKVDAAYNKGGLVGAKFVGYGALSIVAPEVAIPLMMTDLTGVPVLPSPQAFSSTVVSTTIEASTIETSTSNIPSGVLFQPADLPNSAIVVRGGLCKAANFENGTGVTVGQGGKLSGVSVGSQEGATVETLSSYFPHPKVGATTAGEIRAMGGDVSPLPTSNNPTHATTWGLDASQLEKIFNPVFPNPIK